MLSPGFKKNTPQGTHLPSSSEHGAGQAFWSSGLIPHCGGLGRPLERRLCLLKPSPAPAPAAHTALPPAVAEVAPQFQLYHWLLHALLRWALTQVRTSPACTGHLWPVPGPQLHAVWLAFRRRGSLSPMPSPSPTAPGVGRHPLHPAGGRPPALWGHMALPSGWAA